MCNSLLSCRRDRPAEASCMIHRHKTEIAKLFFSQGKLMKTQRWRYYQSKWNLLEMTIILISWSALSVFVKRTILGTRDISYYQEHKEE